MIKIYGSAGLNYRFVLLYQDSRAQVTAIHLIIGTLQRMHVFGVENRDTLTHKATGVIIELFYLAAVNVYILIFLF